MFGFLAPNRRAISYRVYRQSYSRCCRFQKQAYGTTSLLFLSYEAVFFYLLAVDTESISAPAADEVTCCRLRTQGCSPTAPDAAIARFSAAIGLLLTQVKLNDDILDEGRFTARLLRQRLKRQFSANREYLQAFDAHLLPRLDDTIAQHLKLERQTNVPLDIYARPTATAFGRLFEAAAPLLAGVPAKQLFELGQNIGAALVASDAAIDWPQDLRRGRYNPLADGDEVVAAYRFAADHLNAAGWICNEIGSGTLAIDVLKHAITRVQKFGCRREPLIQTGRRQRGVTRLLSPAKWLPMPSRAGFCDCDCGCDACCGDGCCCDGCNSTPDVPTQTGGCDGCGLLRTPTCCDICVCCDCCEPWNRNQQTNRALPVEQSKAAGNAITDGQAIEDQESLVGKQGTVTTVLSPSGFVLIDGTTYPARSEAEMIVPGTDVVVVKQAAFGLIVRAQ